MPEPACARCGLPRHEHSYNGACYGLCGVFTVAAADPLPPADVAVEHLPPGEDNGYQHGIKVKVDRAGAKGREFLGTAGSLTGAVKDAVGKILNDPVSAEYIRKG